MILSASFPFLQNCNLPREAPFSTGKPTSHTDAPDWDILWPLRFLIWKPKHSVHLWTIWIRHSPGKKLSAAQNIRASSFAIPATEVFSPLGKGDCRFNQNGAPHVTGSNLYYNNFSHCSGPLSRRHTGN